MQWDDIWPELEAVPVRGNPADYATAGRIAGDLVATVEAVADEFERVRADDSLDAVRGQTADQLVALVNDIDGSIVDLPPVLGRLESIFDRHHDELDDLQRAADDALARAITNWNERNTARDEHDDAVAALADIDGSIWWARTNIADDELRQQRLDDLRRRRSEAEWVVQTKSSALDSATSDLAASRSDYETLRDREDALVVDSRRRLDDIGLGDLRDPSGLGGFLSGVGGFLKSITIDALVELGEAIVKLADIASLGDLLWRLSDCLGAALAVLAVVALAVAVFASGGTLLLVIGTIALYGATAKVAIDALLAASGAPHPDTGETMSWSQVAIEIVMLSLSYATGGAAGAKGPIGAAFRNPAASSSTYGSTALWAMPDESVGSTMAPAIANWVGRRSAIVGASLAHGNHAIPSTAVDFTVATASGRAESYLIEQYAPDTPLNTKLDTHGGGLLTPEFLHGIATAPITVEGVRQIRGDRRLVLTVPRAGVDLCPDNARYPIFGCATEAPTPTTYTYDPASTRDD